MATSRNNIDWDRLRPRILQDLADGKTQQQIRDELAQNPDNTFRVSISKSQLETQLKHWKYRNSLHSLEWKVVSHRINKRRKAGRTTSQVLVNGFILNERKVAKAISRYDTPTLVRRSQSPKIPTELSHHLIEVRTPPPSHRPLQLPPLGEKVAQMTRDSFALHLNSSEIGWPQTAQWMKVELSVGQFVARFFLPTYEQDERFRVVFNKFGRKSPLSSTSRGQKVQASRANHDNFLSDQASDISTDPHDCVPVHQCNIQRSFGGLRIHTAVVRTLVGLLYGLSNQSLGYTGSEALASIMAAPAWDTVLPRLRDVLAMIDSKLFQAIAEGLLKESIETFNQSMLDLSLELGADPTKRIRVYDTCESRYVLSTPFVAICINARLRWDVGPEKLILSLLKRDPHVSNTALLWIISANCHSIAENVIRSQPERAIDFTIELSDFIGDIRSDLENHSQITPLLVACSDRRRSAARLSLIRCLLERKAKADLLVMLAAAHACDGEVISLLCQHGAPVNGFVPKLGSPLSVACFTAADLPYNNERITAIPLLLRLGASPNDAVSRVLSSWNFSPLHILAYAEEWAEVTVALDLLLKHGADINYRAIHPDYDLAVHAHSGEILGMTALEWAIQNSRWISALQILSADCELTGRELFFINSIECHSKRHQVEPVQKRFRQFISALLAKAPEQAIALHWSGLNVLQWAIRNEDEHMILALFEFGVSPTPSDFLYMLCNRKQWNERTHVCLLSSIVQMKLVLAARFSKHPITDMSTVRLILAFACPEVIRHTLDCHPDVYDSEGLCYVIPRLVTKGRASCLWRYYRLEEENRQAASLSMDDFRALISRRTISNRHEDWESTAVVMAARAGRTDIVRVLIEPSQESVRNSGLIPLFLLREVLTCDFSMIQPPDTTLAECNSGHLDVWVKYCQMDVPNMRCSPLTAAAMILPVTAAAEIFDLLLLLNYKPDAWTVLVASCRGHLSILRQLSRFECWLDILSHENRPDWCPTALQIAVYNGHLDIVRFLLDEATVTDSMDLSPDHPFHFVQLGDSGPLDSLTILPRTALQHAVDKENMEMITLLVNAGANVNAPAPIDSGATALQIVSIQGSIPMMKYLISQGADPSAAGAARHGRTALEGAAEHGRKDAVELLLDQCESIAYQHRKQLVKAIYYAEKNGQHVVAGILRERLLPQWSSEDEETVEMLSEDLESSSGRSELHRLQAELDDWEETFEDMPECLRAYEGDLKSGVRSEESQTGNPMDLQEDDFWYLQEWVLGSEGHEEMDVYQTGETDLFDGDVSTQLTFPQDDTTLIDHQPSTQGWEIEGMILGDFYFDEFS